MASKPIKSPSNERLGFHSGDMSGLKNGTKINVSYIDTHVGTITLKNATTGDPLNCATAPNGEPMYYNIRIDSKGQATHQKGPATLTDPTSCYDSF